MHNQSTNHDPERDLPQASEVVFQAAGLEAIANGASIVESADGKLYEVLPDGTRNMIGHVKPTTSYPPDTKIDLR